MRFKTIGLFGLWDRYRDDWLISPQAERLFLFSTILVLPLTPVFLGRVDPKSLSFWLRLPLSILGVLGPIALFFFGGSACGGIGGGSIAPRSMQSDCGWSSCWLGLGMEVASITF